MACGSCWVIRTSQPLHRNGSTGPLVLGSCDPWVVESVVSARFHHVFVHLWAHLCIGYRSFSEKAPLKAYLSWSTNHLYYIRLYLDVGFRRNQLLTKGSFVHFAADLVVSEKSWRAFDIFDLDPFAWKESPWLNMVAVIWRSPDGNHQLQTCNLRYLSGLVAKSKQKHDVEATDNVIEVIWICVVAVHLVDSCGWYKWKEHVEHCGVMHLLHFPIYSFGTGFSFGAPL